MPFISLESIEQKPARSGFIPLAEIEQPDEPGQNQASFRGHGASGTWDEADKPQPENGAIKTLRAIGQVYPVAETAANLVTQGGAMPVAGLAGLGALATNAAGLTDKPAGDVVNDVAGAMTYHPKTEMGQHLTKAAMYPFEKLHEGATAAGDATLDATGSPGAATAVHTAIEGVAPMLIVPGARAIKSATESRKGFKPLNAQRDAVEAEFSRHVQEQITDDPTTSRPNRSQGDAQAGVERMAGDEAPLSGTEIQGQPEVRRSVDQGMPGLPEVPGAKANSVLQPVERRVDAEVTPDMSVPDVPVRAADGAGPAVAPVRAVEIDTRLNEIAADLPHRTTAVQDSLMREAAKLERERSELMAEAQVRHGVTEPADAAARPADPMPEAMTQPAPEVLAAGTETLNSWAPGMNYVPLVDDAKLPTSAAKTAADLPAPIRRDNIIHDFARALGTTVYEGRVKGKSRLGFFRPRNEEVRIKKANDIEVTAHELAHLIDSRVPAISNVWRSDKALREELKSVSYDRANVQEGFAEGMRLFLTQPDALQAKAPKVFKWLDDFANTHEYGPALKKAQADMTGWYGQDALNRARSKIGDDAPMSRHFEDIWDKFRQSVLDDLHGVYRMERELKGGIVPNGAYEAARLSRASTSMADGAIRYGAPLRKPDGSHTFTGKGLEEILKPVSEKLEDTLLYFVGRSSRELLAQGREHLFTPAEIDAMLKLSTPERKKAFEEYQSWNKGILDFAEQAGVINPQARAMWQRTQYLPFHRIGQPGNFKGGKPGDYAEIQALTGGTENLRDILSNMVQNAAQLIDKASKNEARVKIANMAEANKGGKFMVKIPAESRPVKVDPRQTADAVLKALGINRAEWRAKGQKLPKWAEKIVKELENSPDFLEFMIGNQPPAGSNVVAVLRGGKPEWYEVGDPLLYRSLTSIDRKYQHWLIQWLGLPKRIGQASITLTPDFWVANMARDTIMGSIMSRHGFKPVLDSLRGMRSRMMSDPVYKDYIANGGGLSSIYLDETKLRAKMEKFYNKQGIDYRTVLDTPDKLLGFVETLGDSFEMSTRLGEYKRAIAAGEHPRHAAYLGREVSTDFAMRGDSQAIGMMYDIVMFMKPAVLSWDRMARGLAHDPNKGAIAAKAGTLALASAALYLLNKDDPRYQDLPDWDRDTNWHFFVGDQHFRYPKIWEVGALASGAERMVEKTLAEDPEGLGKDFARILGATFNLNMMPQVVAPLYQQATNRNSFTKSPIETPGMENVQPFLRAKPSTSETFKALGMATADMPEALQVNPVRAEALLRGYFNTWAQYGLMLSDSAFFGDQLPERRLDEMPVVRRFIAQEPARHTKYETQFYDLLEEAQRMRGTLRELDRLGMSDLADKKEKHPLTGEATPLARAQKSLSGINKDMRDVRQDDSLTPEQKREKLDELITEKNALLKAVVMDSKAAQKEAQPVQ